MKYQKFLMTSVKATSKKGTEIVIVDPKLVEEFLNELKDDETISLEIRALVALGISTGGRINELLYTKTNHVSGNFIDIMVSKKRHHAHRSAKIHPVAQELLSKLSRKGDQSFFRIDRKQAWYQIKKNFGMCNHSLRHTHISYLVEAGVHQMKIAKIMNLSNSNIVAAYSHCNVKRELDEVWTNKKVS